MLIEQLFWGIYQRGAVVIRSGDVVFDVGSHLGTFSRFALNRGVQLVVAFEPESTNITCYKQTFQREIEEGRVILVEAAVWETPGTLSFSDAKLDNSGTGIVRAPEDECPGVKVPATSIDETVSRLNLDRVDFIKMDIEGAERHALRGARRSLARFGPRLAVCIYHRSDDPAARRCSPAAWTPSIGQRKTTGATGRVPTVTCPSTSVDGGVHPFKHLARRVVR